MWVAGPSYFAVEHLTACLIYWWPSFVYTQFVATSDEEMEAETLCIVFWRLKTGSEWLWSSQSNQNSKCEEVRYVTALLYLYQLLSIALCFRLHLHLSIIILHFLPRLRLYFSCKMKIWLIRWLYLLCNLFVTYPSSNCQKFVWFSRNMSWALWRWRRTRNWRTFLLPKLNNNNTRACEILRQERYECTWTLRIV